MITRTGPGMADGRDAADGEAGQLVRLARGGAADVGSPVTAARRARSTRFGPGDEAQDRLEPVVAVGATKTSDLTIWPSSAPTAAAASSAVWVDSSKTVNVERDALAGGGVDDALDGGMVGGVGHGAGV